MATPFQIETVREAFPGITRAGRRRIYLDAPGGTQVAATVVRRMTDCMIDHCANEGGPFETSLGAGEIWMEAHRAAADLVGAEGPENVVFGYNSTSLLFHFSRMLAADWRAGDNIVLTTMDHDGNISPWLKAAEVAGVELRWLRFTASYVYDYEALTALIDHRTRLVACNHASNFLGTLNDVARNSAAARAIGAVSVVDAVQSAPHVPLDVRAIGCDLLVWSAYKVFGPHIGVLFGRRELLDALDPIKVRPASMTLPTRFELGTPSFEGLAGVTGAVEHLAWLGDLHGNASGASRRNRVLAGLSAAGRWEDQLARRLLQGLTKIEGLRLFGLSDPDRFHSRVPTFTFKVEGRSSSELAQALADENIFVWSGHYFAVEAARQLDLGPDGAVRIGLAHYNTEDDVETCLDVLERAIAGQRPIRGARVEAV
jgi:cysteine desulfurase family protein (TIGR01976 family)